MAPYIVTGYILRPVTLYGSTEGTTTNVLVSLEGTTTKVLVSFEST